MSDALYGLFIPHQKSIYMVLLSNAPPDKQYDYKIAIPHSLQPYKPSLTRSRRRRLSTRCGLTKLFDNFLSKVLWALLEALFSPACLLMEMSPSSRSPLRLLVISHSQFEMQHQQT